MKKVIQLESRDGTDNKLIQVGNSDSRIYKLSTPYHYRMGFKEDPEDITFIDPSGGPFIQIGSEIEGHIVKSIHSDATIEFE